MNAKRYKLTSNQWVPEDSLELNGDPEMYANRYKFFKTFEELLQATSLIREGAFALETEVGFWVVKEDFKAEIVINLPSADIPDTIEKFKYKVPVKDSEGQVVGEATIEFDQDENFFDGFYSDDLRVHVQIKDQEMRRRLLSKFVNGLSIEEH